MPRDDAVPTDPRLEDADWLRRRYADERATPEEIARELKCNRRLVSQALCRHAIPGRGVGRPRRPGPVRHTRHPLLGDAGWLRLRWEEGEAVREMAQEIRCSQRAVYDALHEHGILKDKRRAATTPVVTVPPPAGHDASPCRMRQRVAFHLDSLRITAGDLDVDEADFVDYAAVGLEEEFGRLEAALVRIANAAEALGYLDGCRVIARLAREALG